MERQIDPSIRCSRDYVASESRHHSAIGTSMQPCVSRWQTGLASIKVGRPYNTYSVICFVQTNLHGNSTLILYNRPSIHTYYLDVPANSSDFGPSVFF